MRGINKAIIVGTVGKDPETRAFPDGSAVTNISVATSEQWKDRTTGEKKERTDWHNVVCKDRGAFKLGEIAGQYLTKGSKVYFEGKLQTRMWEKDGVKRYATEIIASEMQMLGDAPGGSKTSVQQVQQPATQTELNSFDDDIPF